jgi:hypothetical protein
LVLSFAFAQSSLACLESHKIDPEKLSEAESTLTGTNSTIARLEALHTLLLSKNTSIKSYAIDLARTSDSRSLQAAGLRCDFLRANAIKITVKSYDEAGEFIDGASDGEKQILESGREDIFPIYHKNAGENCVSTNGHYDDECVPRLSAFVKDLSITLVNDRSYRATFTLDEKNELVGTISIWHGSGYHVVPGVLQFR